MDDKNKGERERMVIMSITARKIGEKRKKGKERKKKSKENQEKPRKESGQPRKGRRPVVKERKKERRSCHEGRTKGRSSHRAQQ